MAYRIRYQVNVEFVAPGMSAMTGGGNIAGPGLAPTGVGSTLAFFDTPGIASITSPTFTGTDITNLTNAMAADIAAQMNANIGRVQGFATGGS